jgi:CheY-like chemotaxis protein
VTTKPKILIVDDNEINRFLLKKMLSKYPFLLDFCENGQEALDKLLAKEFDVVLMDIHMPVMSGLEATKNIREFQEPYFKELPIIALTASILPDDIEEIYKIGFNDYQSKPFKIEELIAKISKLCPVKD